MGISTATGWRITRRARRAHGPSAPGSTVTLRIAAASILVPTMARIAGSSVSAEATASPTTIAPAMPTERRIMNSNRTRPSRPSSTVRPEKNTARPAVATVTRTASADAILLPGPMGQLLAEPAGHQQRVVHAQPEAEQRGQVDHEDAHRGQRGHDEDPRQRDEHGGAAHRQRHARRHRAAEDDQQRERRQRQRDQLGAPQVRLGHGLDVAVERGAAADPDRQPRDLVQGRLHGRDRRRRVVRGQVEEHDVVGGVPVGGHLPRREDVRQDAGDVRRGRHVLGGGVHRGQPRGRARGHRVRGVDEHERRRLDAELLLQHLLGARGLEVVEDEAARGERARGARGERDRDEDEEGPGGDDPPPPADGEAPESIEGHALTGSRGAGCGGWDDEHARHG